ncbi:hypothetical protein GMMP15_1300023 [Candidatus Magnetomoraceae bacterium gMMP-15]
MGIYANKSIDEKLQNFHWADLSSYMKKFKFIHNQKMELRLCKRKFS